MLAWAPTTPVAPHPPIQAIVSRMTVPHLSRVERFMVPPLLAPSGDITKHADLNNAAGVFGQPEAKRADHTLTNT
jgi:hypothetical protein